jgi:chromatin remodeling complex protein RSC6
MQSVFKVKTMTMFSMNKKLSPHIKPADEIVGSGFDAPPPPDSGE